MTETDGQRSQEAVQYLVSEMEMMARKTGRNPDTTVGIGQPGSGFFWDFNTNHISLDPVELARAPEEENLGSAGHEGNHVRHSYISDRVRSMWKEPGFRWGLNADEDPAVNQAGMAENPGTEKYIHFYVSKDLGPNGGLDYKSVKKDAKEQLGYVPKHMQYGSEVIRYWFEKRFNHAFPGATPNGVEEQQALQQFLDQIPDGDVRTAMAQTLASHDRFVSTYAVNADEPKRRSKAVKRGDIFIDEIWPVYKELVDESYQDHQIVKMLEDMMKDGGGQIVQIPFDQLPQDIQDAIDQAIQEQKQQGQGGNKSQDQQKSGGSAGQSQNASEQSADSSGDSKTSSGGEGEGTEQGEGQSESGQEQSAQGGGQSSQGGESGDQNQPGESQSSSAGEAGQSGASSQGQSNQEGTQKGGQGAGQDGQEGQETQDGSENGGKGQVPWDALSDKTKQGLKDFYNQNLTDDQKQQLKDQADQELGDVEKQMADRMQSKSNNPNVAQQTEEPSNESDADQTSDNTQLTPDKSAQQNPPAPPRVKLNIDALNQLMEAPKTESVFDQYAALPEVGLIVQKWTREFRTILAPNEEPEVRMTSDGITPSIRGAMQNEADPRFTDVFEERGELKKNSRRWLFLVDMSSSMQGGKIEQVFRNIVAFTQTMRQYRDVEFSIAGFTDTFPGAIRVYKGFEQKLTPEVIENIGRLLTDCYREGSSTPTTQAVIAAHDQLLAADRRRPMATNYLTVFTDGQPNEGTQALRDQIIALQQTSKRTAIVGYGIGPGSEFINQCLPPMNQAVLHDIAKAVRKPYGEISYAFEDATDFANAFTAIISNQVEHPERFS